MINFAVQCLLFELVKTNGMAVLYRTLSYISGQLIETITGKTSMSLKVFNPAPFVLGFVSRRCSAEGTSQSKVVFLLHLCSYLRWMSWCLLPNSKVFVKF
ncbi:hypothetical protein CHARACLAT_002555 [Characodon lateralis]|uniref:Uncharacterized protein n=1 Tax=Characodon lateralis TaxID=208331 RepID=A0ABU7CN33_9TELE|nr:hypothetical protein [Characodon lateralis]